MELADFYHRVVDTLERLGISYRIVGSMASIAYGEPRFTNDIGVVVQLDLEQAAALCAAFPEPDFYCSVDAARQAVQQRFQFNILHPASGLKVDVIVAADSPFGRSQFARGQRLPAESHEAWVASPEDVILKKVEYFKEGGSEKHLRDIVGILKVQGEKIEFDYLREWIEKLGVQEEWQLVQSRMPKPNEGKS